MQNYSKFNKMLIEIKKIILLRVFELKLLVIAQINRIYIEYIDSIISKS